MTDALVHATPLVDVLEVDDGAVVLVESEDRARVVKVSAIAQSILAIAQGGATLTSIAVELSARFGVPSDGSIDDAVRALVDELAGQGLVQVRPRG